MALFGQRVRACAWDRCSAGSNATKSWMREEMEVGGEAMSCEGSSKACPVLARELVKGKGGT